VGKVIIGTDPHKRSATIEVRDEREILLAAGRFAMDKTGYRQLLGYARQWPDGCGRSRAPTGRAGRWRPGCWPPPKTMVDVPAEPAALDSAAPHPLADPGQRFRVSR
jgi:transposase